MPRYLLSEFADPNHKDYFYEANYYQCERSYVKMHTHHYYEFYLFMADGGKMIIDGEIYDLDKGCLAIIPPDIQHTWAPEDNVTEIYDKYYLWITEHCINTFNLNEFSLLPVLKRAEKEKIFVIDLKDEDKINLVKNSFIQLAISKKQDASEYGLELMNRAHILSSLVTINRCITQKIHPHDSGKKKVVRDLIQYIDENYMHEISLDTLAAEFHINKFSLSKTFKAETGMTLHYYLSKHRISMAKIQMLDGVLPTKVYFSCGYKNYTSFFRAFVNIEGKTPNEFAMHFRSDTSPATPLPPS